MKAVIRQKPKNTMQSGRDGLDTWFLEYESASKRSSEDIMGWSSSSDTLNQVSIKFDRLEDAVAFADKKSLEYQIKESGTRKFETRNYMQNFKYTDPKEKTK